ncbi:MAG: hypothetical protein JKY51_01535 [Opitutaceae bacterium]|nr:hypothetical protein [Opitutaceae bacterium]
MIILTNGQFSTNIYFWMNLLWTKSPPCPFNASTMATNKPTKASIFFDLLLTAGVFVYLFFVLQKHVMGYSDPVVYGFAAYGASSIAAGFWLALQMFKVVLSHQLNGKK